MKHLIPVTSYEDILPEFRNTPVGLLLEYHNLGRTLDDYENAEILVGMCMDNRKMLCMPDNFAYVIRSAGGNLRYSEFKTSYAIAIGGVKAIALIGHNNCGMVNLFSKQKAFIEGLVNNAGWTREWAEQHFMHFSPMFEIGNEVDFVLSEAKRIRMRYPGILVAPLFYQLEDNLLYQLNEKNSS